MACYTAEIDEYGDQTLLESMLFSFGSATRNRKKLSIIQKDEIDEELDLKKILSTPGHDHLLGELDEEVGLEDEGGKELRRDTESVRFLYRRSEATPKLAEISDEKSQTLTQVLRLSSKRPHFVQAYNDYRKFMEETMLIKFCCKQTYLVLEEARIPFNRCIDVKNEPGLEKIKTVQAWVWILKEAIIHSYSATSKDRKRRKFLEAFLTETIGSVEELYKQLLADTKRLVRTYQKIDKELTDLIKKSARAFANNVEGARQYELTTSGYDFFARRLDEESRSSLVKRRKREKKQRNKVNPTHEHSLKVRCSVDGVTIHSGKAGGMWHKFQSVDQDKDKQVFIKIFANELRKPCLETRADMALIQELLEVPNAFSKSKLVKDSIFQSISSCKKLLEKPLNESHFLPKEEMVLLYSLNTTRAALTLLRPLLTELTILSGKMCGMVDGFYRQRKLLRKNIKIGRVPLQRYSRFELQVEDAKVNIDLILNRYPNLYDAKHMRDKFLQKLMDGSSIFDEIFLEEPRIELLYKCPSEIFFTPSTQELMSRMRKLIREQRAGSSDPNPAHLLFVDLQEEYNDRVASLIETREITPEMLILCSDPIRRFYRTTQEMVTSKKKILNYLLYATENLTCFESRGDSDSYSTHIPSSHWIHQIICKALRVWDFHSLPYHLQRHFHSVVETSMNRIESLGDTFASFTSLAKEFQAQFLHLWANVESVHSFSTWIRREFEFDTPDRIMSKWKEEAQEHDPESSESLTNTSQQIDLSSLKINFYMFDMELVKIDPDNKETALLSLSKCSSSVQIGIFSILFTYLNHLVNRAIVNLNSASAIFQRSITIKGFKTALASPNRKLFTSLLYFHQLEDMTLALTFETLHRSVKEMMIYVGLVGGVISQFKQMYQLIQLHLEDRGIIDPIKNGDSQGHPTRKKKKLSRKEFEMEQHNNNNDVLMELLRKSIEVMPNTFEIKEDSLLKHSFLHWVKIAERDSRLRDSIRLQLMEALEGGKEDEIEAEAGATEDCSINSVYDPDPTINVEVDAIYV